MSLIAGTWDLKAATSEAAEKSFKVEPQQESVFEDLQDDRKLVPLDEIQRNDGKYRCKELLLTKAPVTLLMKAISYRQALHTLCRPGP
jgi:hypothetical protein